MRVRAGITQARELARVSAEASRRYGVGRMTAARRARRLRTAGNFQYEETLAAGLLDPTIDEADALRNVSEHDTTRLVDRLNAEALAAVTAEKAIFYRHASALGIRVPELYGLVGRAGGWSAASGRPLSARATAAFLADEPPADFVVKPSAGHHGLGVRVLRREGAGLVDLEGRRHDPAALAAELLADPDFDLFVVQERLRNHEALLRLCPAETLQTVRMTTFVTDEGESQVLHAGLKLAFGGRNVDNFRGGTTGNAFVEVDVATGRLGRPAGPPADGIEGAALPDWEAACEVVRRGALLLLPQRTMGWDVGLTPAGPVVVEANRGYDPFPTPAFGAVVRAIEGALLSGGPAVVEGAAGPGPGRARTVRP